MDLRDIVRFLERLDENLINTHACISMAPECRQEEGLHRYVDIRVVVEDDLVILVQNTSDVLDLKPCDFVSIRQTTKDG